MFLKTNGLTKDYGNQKGAFDVDLEITPGEVVGFIGPNGAGKSTSLGMIAGYTKPTRGGYSLFGQDISWGEALTINPQFVVMPSEGYFKQNYSVKKIFNRMKALLGADQSRIDLLVDVFKVDQQKKFGELSLGNKKKVSLISTLMADADLYMFDEPTSGLDPLMQQIFLNELKLIRSKKKSVLLSSHVLSEVQSICDRLYMIKEGKIIFSGHTGTILEEAFKIIKVYNPTKTLKAKIQKIQTVDRVVESNQRIDVYTNKRLDVVSLLVKEGVEDFLVENPQLEEMFLESYK